MILAALQSGQVGYPGAAVVLRAAYYVGSLGGAGLAFFALLLGSRQEATDAERLRRWALGAAVLGLLAGIGALAAQVGVLTDGEALTDPEVWNVVLASRAGSSYGLGGAGLLLVALLAVGSRWTIPAALGGVLVCASYALLGHTTMLTPRPVLAGLLLVHLLVAAFWIGSLLPLAWSARREGPAAAHLVEAWARVAMIAVPVLAVAGLLLAWWILGGVQQLFASWYGWALLAKLALVSVLLGFAAWHHRRLTPALAANIPGAGRRLARSIAMEALVAMLVLYAAAEMVSTSPDTLVHAMN
ncbi:MULTISPECIES: copper resistance D family protein [Roseicella]|uniref:copper resistance D family protein n=1 Tax=Roseicella TaxID=2730923 RepID=UPI001F107198|nr:CopD family protein [Roseicella aquatilis]